MAEDDCPPARCTEPGRLDSADQHPRSAQEKNSLSKLVPGLHGVSSGDVIWLLLMSSMLFLLLLPFSSFVAALSLIQDEWRLNNTQAGTVYAAYQAGYAVSALFIIPLTDRVRPKYIFLGSAVVSVVSHALFPIAAGGMASSALLRAVAGLGLAGVYMPGLRVISERFAERGRGMAMGIFVTAFYTANSVSLAVTGGLMNWLEWRQAFLVMALASAAGVPLAYRLLRDHRPPLGRRSSGRLDLTVLRNRPARIYILGYSLHAVELYSVRVWLPAFLVAILVAQGISDAQAAVTAATVGGIALATGSVGPMMGGMVSDRWGRTASASAILALSCACAVAIGWLGGFPFGAVVGLGAVYAWAIAADSSIYSTAVTEVSPASQLGSTMALQAFLGFMGGVIGPIAVGGILDISPESLKWGLGFSFLGVLSLLAIFGLTRVRSLPRAGLLTRGGG